jgi:hypothetical protein
VSSNAMEIAADFAQAIFEAGKYRFVAAEF